MVISDTIFAMLLTESYFKTFTKKEVSDVKTATEVLIALDANSKGEVRERVNRQNADRRDTAVFFCYIKL